MSDLPRHWSAARNAGRHRQSDAKGPGEFSHGNGDQPAPVIFPHGLPARGFARMVSAPLRDDPTRRCHLTHPLDFSVLQQCICCGMCLPTCPTYDANGKLERNSPRGRIALMRHAGGGESRRDRGFRRRNAISASALSRLRDGVRVRRESATRRCSRRPARRHPSGRASLVAAPRRSLVRAFALRFVFAHPAGSAGLRKIAALVPRPAERGAAGAPVGTHPVAAAGFAGPRAAHAAGPGRSSPMT